MKTEWTDERLQKLYDQYNQKYWSGRLPTFQVVNDSMPEDFKTAWGLCLTKEKQIIIAISKHPSDTQVRSTLLHEMCHVAARRAKRDHGSEFFEQLERLLRMRAPISIGFPEADGRVILDIAQVPARFRLCRKAMRKAMAAHQRKARRIMREQPSGTEIELTMDMIAGEFEEVASIQGAKWRTCLLVFGREYALLDIDDKPLKKYASLIEAARKGHRKGWKWYREQQKAEAIFRDMADEKI